MKHADKKLSKIIMRNTQRFQLLVQRNDFQEDVRDFRQRWHIPQRDLRSNEAIAAWRKKHFMATEFNNDLAKLLFQYELPGSWKGALNTYMFINKAEYFGPLGVWVRVAPDKAGNEEVSVVLDAFATRQDFIEAWPEIEHHLKELRARKKQKFQPLNKKILERNKLAYELKQQGMKYADIASRLNEQYEGAFAYTDIPTMIRNYKKVLGIN